MSAVAGIYFSLEGNIKFALLSLMVSGVCDLFDGTVARMAKRNNREKAFGIQIDSLADIIAFGILPTVIGYAIYKAYRNPESGMPETICTILVMGLYSLAALIRLAYFNVTEAELQSKDEKRRYYEGLPVTSVALIIPAVCLLCIHFNFCSPFVYNILLILLALAFVLKVKIPKIRIRYMIGLCLIGLPMVIYFLVKGGIGR